MLEATYQVIILRPYHANIGKRLVKTPKVYFTDVGTLCHLAGLKDPRHAAQGPMGGPLMAAEKNPLGQFDAQSPPRLVAGQIVPADQLQGLVQLAHLHGLASLAQL